MVREPHPCVQADKIESIKEDTQEIKADMKDVKADLSEHMARTAKNEVRIELMETFVVKQAEMQQENFKMMMEQNQNTLSKFNRQAIIMITIFTGISGLITALASWLSNG